MKNDHNYIKNQKYGFTERQVRFFVESLVERLTKAVMEPG